jgi:hypothetical protein
VGDGISTLMDSSVKVDAIELLLIVVDKGDKLWLWWIKVGERKEHDGLSLTQRVLILLKDE